MKDRLRDHAPLSAFPLLSLILVAGLNLRIGFERRSRTTYRPLQDYVAAFGRLNEAPAGVAESAVRHDALDLVTDAVRKEYSPVEADELLARLNVAGPQTPRRNPAVRAKRIRRVPPPTRPASDSTVAQIAAPAVAAAPAAPAGDTLESVGDAYENNQARYALDTSAAAGGITLRLLGVARARDRYILKIAVTNAGSNDFFVRELTLRAGREPLIAKSFLRLFVEPGRTREGYVVFDKPRSDVDVHAALKEDRENGRVLETPVPYPF